MIETTSEVERIQLRNVVHSKYAPDDIIVQP
jgi:hypothetical protein